MKINLNFESTTELLNFIDQDNTSKTVTNACVVCPEKVTFISDLIQSLPIQIEPLKYWKDFTPFNTGMFFDVGLVCSGVPECWLDLQETSNKGSFATTELDGIRPVIKLGINVNAFADTPKETIIERGLIIAVLAFLLEYSGRAVSITQYFSMESNNHSFLGSVILKSTDEVLDTNLLTFWLISIDSFQSCWSRVLQKLLITQRGCILNSKHGDTESDIFIEGITNKTVQWNRNDSIQWVCSQLEKLKIEFNS